MKKILTFIRGHKIITVIVLAALAGGGYFEWKNLNSATQETRYVLAAAEKKTIVASVSGSGQVSAANEEDIKPKVSGDIVSVSVKNGQKVKAGDIVAKIDSQEAQRNVRDAETALKTAKLELDELVAPPDKLALLQAENAVASAKQNLTSLLKPADALDLLKAESTLTDARDSLTKLKFTQATDYQKALDAKAGAEDDLKKAVDDGFNAIANTFLVLPTMMTGLENVLYSDEIDASEATIVDQDNITALKNSILYNDRTGSEKFFDSAESDYAAAEEKYNKNFTDYKNTSRYADQEAIEALLDETIETTKAAAESTKSEHNLLDYWVDYRTKNILAIFKKVTAYQSNLDTYTGQTNSYLSSLLSVQKNIKDDKTAIANAERDLAEMDQNQPLDLSAAEKNVTEKEKSLAELKAGADASDIEASKRSLAEKEASLEKLKAGATDLDIRTKKVAIQQKEDALADARQTLADYTVYAPFDGVIASVSAEKGDAVSAGTDMATIITAKQIAEVSLNEVDVAKVKTGQKATLTFDAISDLNLTGEVADIETIGTVSQGVVNYTVKIALDVQDERVKSGMTVSASIITEARQNVLAVPNAAVKSSADGSYYVEILDGAPASAAQNLSGILSQTPPRQQAVEIGLTSDSLTEIISGVKEGDLVVSRTTTSTSTSSSSSSSSKNGNNNFRMPGIGGGFGR